MTRRLSRHLIAPVILIALIAAAWGFGLADRLSWAHLSAYQTELKALVAAHPWLAPCLFVLIYVATVALSLPHAALLTVIGGLLFGTLLGGVLAATGATIGAVLLFLIARSAFARPLANRGGAALAKLRDELGRNGFSYLLALRLLPVVPFWLINLAAALCGMRLRPFVIATLIGIQPVTFITASIGAGLGGALSAGTTPRFSLLFSWPVLGPLLVLAILSVSPVIWRKWRTAHA